MASWTQLWATEARSRVRRDRSSKWWRNGKAMLSMTTTFTCQQHRISSTHDIIMSSMHVFLSLIHVSHKFWSVSSSLVLGLNFPALEFSTFQSYPFNIFSRHSRFPPPPSSSLNHFNQQTFKKKKRKEILSKVITEQSLCTMWTISLRYTSCTTPWPHILKCWETVNSTESASKKKILKI